MTSTTLQRLGLDPNFVGLRAREVHESCPTCDDPGSGMWQDLDMGRWICTRCYPVARYHHAVAMKSQAETMRRTAVQYMDTYRWREAVERWTKEVEDARRDLHSA